jgi:hypothetical protein
VFLEATSIPEKNPEKKAIGSQGTWGCDSQQVLFIIAGVLNNGVWDGSYILQLILSGKCFWTTKLSSDINLGKPYLVTGYLRSAIRLSTLLATPQLIVYPL